MDLNLNAGTGFELEASLTGIFQVSLTRAVLPYRDGRELALPGGRLADVGLGVVIDGADPARAEVVDLGSAEIRVVDLTGPLVVLGWLYPSGLRSLRRVVEDSGFEELDRTRAFTFNMALRALNSAGFSPLTRPTVLRIGFRDLCQDLDLHEGTAVRLLLPSGGWRGYTSTMRRSRWLRARGGRCRIGSSRPRPLTRLEEGSSSAARFRTQSTPRPITFPCRFRAASKTRGVCWTG